MLQYTAAVADDFLNPVPFRPEPATNAMFAKLIDLETELSITQTESKFRDDLCCWILGSRPDGEYRKCRWVDQQALRKLPSEHYPFTKALLPNVIGDWTNLNEHPNAHPNAMHQAARMDIKSLLRSSPGITQGMVRDHDIMALQKKEFLQVLTRTVPKTEEEAFLWYVFVLVLITMLTAAQVQISCAGAPCGLLLSV